VTIRSGSDLRNVLAVYKSRLSRYWSFCEEHPPNAEEDAAADAEALTFGLEADLEAALRKGLDQLEPGLHLADEGQQRKVASGFIDIFARDSGGKPVVIELKANQTRPEAVAQVLGYMADIAAEEGVDVRGFLIGADHHPKVEAAARAVPNLALRRYAYRFSFEA